jgi:integrase
MAKIAKALGALEVKRLAEPGQHPVGTVPGLRLFVKPTGAKSWVLRTTMGTKRRDIGLGSYPAVTLAEAWERARAALASIRQGIDPVNERKSKQAAIEWTFKTCALAYIEAFKPSWKNAKHAQQWENTLATYVYPVFGDKHVKDVATEDVVKAVGPLWSTKNETVNRVRNRIELVLSWAAAQGYRPKEFNPAQWRGHLDQVLPKPSKVNKRQHHTAIAVDEAHAFLESLRKLEGTSIRCLEFVILTACRSGEARLATWKEMDTGRGVWNIPGERMKSKRSHRVPLGGDALALLKALPRFKDSDGNDVELVFPGRDVAKPLSDMSLTAIMRRMKLDAVPHGFRSTFRDWAAEKTNYPNEVVEMALAHAIESGTEAAYRRGDLFDKRGHLMADWEKFLTTAPVKGNNVVPILRGVA